MSKCKFEKLNRNANDKRIIILTKDDVLDLTKNCDTARALNLIE